MSFRHSFCVCCLGRQAEDLQLPFLRDYGRQFSVDAATTADVNVKCNHSPRTTEEEVRMGEFITGVKGKDHPEAHIFLSVSAEKVDILRFSVVFSGVGSPGWLPDSPLTDTLLMLGYFLACFLLFFPDVEVNFHPESTA